MIGVSIGEYSLRHSLDLSSVHVFDYRQIDGSNIAVELVSHTETIGRGGTRVTATIVHASGTRVDRRGRDVAFCRQKASLISLSDLPQLDSLVVSGQ